MRLNHLHQWQSQPLPITLKSPATLANCKNIQANSLHHAGVDVGIFLHTALGKEDPKVNGAETAAAWLMDEGAANHIMWWPNQELVGPLETMPDLLQALLPDSEPAAASSEPEMSPKEEPEMLSSRPSGPSWAAPVPPLTSLPVPRERSRSRGKEATDMEAGLSNACMPVWRM
jgi:hypothetical protein